VELSQISRRRRGEKVLAFGTKITPEDRKPIAEIERLLSDP